ncbi:hypothetical protein O4106_22015 [Rhodococcus pyridinivorans]|uniref:hypothetical protein n=1 Tax=Rhodococcus pyridinivorans TaxID=103816 RepID=UPI0022B4740C|nr:hypothetical protein [Rhodococcus pyridinivorans]MCZ4649502.1 hypothetical protein [Rhodococcus pyridinivorans]
MTERDELARDLGNALDASSDEYFGYSDTKSVSWTTLDGKWDLRETADHLIAAGYRKPRSITTETELDELPDDAVLRGANGHISVIHRGTWNGVPHLEVSYAGTEEIDFDYQYIALPATVLYVPEEQK